MRRCFAPPAFAAPAADRNLDSVHRFFGGLSQRCAGLYALQPRGVSFRQFSHRDDIVVAADQRMAGAAFQVDVEISRGAGLVRMPDGGDGISRNAASGTTGADAGPDRNKFQAGPAPVRSGPEPPRPPRNRRSGKPIPAPPHPADKAVPWPVRRSVKSQPARRRNGAGSRCARDIAR